MANYCGLAAELHHSQGGRHIFPRIQSLPVSSGINYGDDFFNRRQGRSACKSGRRITILEVRKCRTAGDIAGIKAAQAVGDGKNPGFGKDQQIVFIAPANTSRVGHPGIRDLGTVELTVSLHEAHLQMLLLEKGINPSRKQLIAP
jgi:hypothetical protein